MLYCPNCGSEVQDKSNFCRECGSTLDKDFSRNDLEHDSEESSSISDGEVSNLVDGVLQMEERQGKPNFFEAFLPYFFPGGSNELEMKRRLGGCPGCGEGRALNFDKNDKFNTYIGDPSGSDIKCERCGTTLKAKKRGFEAVEGNRILLGKSLTQDDCSSLSAMWREEDRDQIRTRLKEIQQGSIKKRDLKQITGDYYWDREAVSPIFWLIGVIGLVIPPIGAFILGWAVVASITTRSD